MFDIHFVSGLYLEARSAQYFLLKVQSALDRSVTVRFFLYNKSFLNNYLNYSKGRNLFSLIIAKVVGSYYGLRNECDVEVVGGGGGEGDKLLWNIYEINWNKMMKIQKIC